MSNINQNDMPGGNGTDEKARDLLMGPDFSMRRPNGGDKKSKPVGQDELAASQSARQGTVNNFHDYPMTGVEDETIKEKPPVSLAGLAVLGAATIVEGIGRVGHKVTGNIADGVAGAVGGVIDDATKKGRELPTLPELIGGSGGKGNGGPQMGG